MRYPKDSTVVTPSDVVLLKYVRNVRFVGHQQLFELLRHDGEIFARSSFNWRVQRLLQSQRLEQIAGTWWKSGAVYSISRCGLIELESQGEFLIGFNSGTRRMAQAAQVFHALELNAVRLALAESGLLAEWQTDLEVSSRNMVSGDYAKDYDALVKLWLYGRQIEFALEYERSLKNAREYEKVRLALEAERDMRSVLYLTAHPDLIVALLPHLACAKRKIGLTTSALFRNQLLSASVTLAGENKLISCEEFLL